MSGSGGGTIAASVARMSLGGLREARAEEARSGFCGPAGLECALIAYLFFCDKLAQSPSEKPTGCRCEPMANSERPTIIEKYANRRLYNTGTYTLVTLDELASMVKRGKEFLVYDAKTGTDITGSVLAQILFQQENSHGAR
jgi:hypothetical protein